MRIIVLGFMVRGPLGGMVWSDLHYLLGLRALGHEVVFVEDSDDYTSCYDPRSDTYSTDPSFGLAFTDRLLDRYGFGDRWAYHDAHTGSWQGPLAGDDAATDADVLLNLAGVNPVRDWHRDIPVRVLIDQDPAFTQLKHRADDAARERATAHTDFFTFGVNVGAEDCRIPDDGLPWRPTRQPVHTDALAPTAAPEDSRYTSVLQWSSYERRSDDGVTYGMKAESFTGLLDVPQRVPVRLELAVGAGGDVQDMLRRHGWEVIDPRPPTADVWTYQDYLQGSRGEFGVAKHGYVASRSGWFSERSTAYLALGRPVVVQDTGFTDWLPTGSGVLAFATEDEAVEALQRVEVDHAAQCRAARRVVCEHFEARDVLDTLLAQVAG